MNKLWAAMIVPVVGIFGAAASVYADSTLVTVNISDTSLELDVPASPTVLTLNPTASGANFGSIDLTATVGTNNPTGYQLSVTFSNTSLSRTVAIDGTTPTIDTLDTLADGYPVADFTVNRWGHKITGDNYFPVPSSTLSPESWSSDEPVNNAQNVITLAAKADGTIPSGIYETTLTYTLVANVATSISFEDAYAAAGKTRDNNTGKYKLQDMNASICDNVDAPIAADNGDTQEAQLVDTRDGKIYWVAKLMDGHCWMTQNLDLDLETTPTHVLALTSENTDLNTYGSNGYDSSNGYSKDANDVITWTPEQNTIPTSSISSAGSITGWTNDYDNPYSIDTGDWYWIGNWKNNGTDTWYASIENNYLNTDGSGAGDKFSTSEYTGNGKRGHVGNYYNWSATIASNNSSSYNDVYGSSYNDITRSPQNSICPSGWRLPTVSNASDTDGSTNEFRRLVTLYGNTTGDDKALTSSPLWFIRGGYVYSSSLYGSGYYGNYWSSTVLSSYEAYNLYFYSSFVSPVNNVRSNGRSVRCVARDAAPDPDPSTTTFDEAFAAAGKTKDTNTNKYKMQDMTPSICSAVTDEQTTTLVDTRDGTVYNVVKALDHRCWLADNLALNLLDSTVQSNMSSSNTNANQNSLTSLFSGNRANGNNYATAGVSNWTSSYSYSVALINITNKDAVSTDALDTAGGWKTGGYYNYCAASAGSYCYGNDRQYGSPVDKDNTAIDAEYDICPSGWRMPTGSEYNIVPSSDVGEYLTLAESISGSTGEITDADIVKDFRRAIRIPYSGYIYNGTEIVSQGSYSLFWSATITGVTGVNYLAVATGVYPTTSGSRADGLSVRCIAKTGTEPAPSGN